MKSRHTILTCLFLLGFPAARAQSLISTGMPDRLFTLGVRAGANTSNINIDSRAFDVWNVNSWGTGFELGAVASINMRDFFSLQPGFFYESRSGNYAYQTETAGESVTQLGHFRHYNFTVPVTAQLRMQLLPGAVWSVDAGPYFSWLLHEKNPTPVYYLPPGAADAGEMAEAELNRYDWGLRVGTGLNFLTHFYAGIHYKAGMRDVWRQQALGGRRKTWTFTVGYDF